MKSTIYCKSCGKPGEVELPGGFCHACALTLALEDAASLPPTNSPITEHQSFQSKENPDLTATKLEGGAESQGATIGCYKLLQKIGEGGCGIVYMAEQEQPVRRRVALKIIKLGMDTKEVIARFEVERQALAMMDHPNIAKVLDAGATDTGRPYFVMELVRGIRITKYCDQQQMPTRERLELFVKVCQAVQHAHQKGIIHRDLKPSNVLVTLHDGIPAPKVIDFGIAKATQGRLTDKTLFTAFEQFIGTPAYMSPEQAEISGLDIDTRSDIYSLGVLLYELLTGQPPFDPEELAKNGFDEIRRRIREDEPPHPSTRFRTIQIEEQTDIAKRRGVEATKLSHQLRGDLDWIVMKCLEKSPSRRYESTSGLAADLQRQLNEEPVLARPPSTLYRLQKLVRRKKALLPATMVVLLVAMVGLGGILWQWNRAELQSDESHQRLVQLSVLNGIKLQSDGDMFGALTWFGESLRLQADRSEDDTVNRIRFGTTLRHLPRLLNFFSITGTVYTATFSPDNGRIFLTEDLAGANGRIWDLTTGQPLTGWLEHTDLVDQAVFSPDGQFLVTSTHDGLAQVWHATDGTPVGASIPLHNTPFYWGQTMDISPDSTLMATRANDNQVQLWTIKSNQPYGRRLDCGGSLRWLEFNSAGNRLLTIAEDLRIWDVATGETLFTQVAQELLYRAKFSPNDRIVAFSSGSNVQLCDSRTGQLLEHSLQHESKVKHIAFSPDSVRLAVVTQDRHITIWNVEHQSEPKEITSFEVDESAATRLTCRFSPDGRWLMTLQLDARFPIRIWDSTTGVLALPPWANAEYLHFANLSPDNERLATCTEDGYVRVWNLTECLTPESFFPHKTQVPSANYQASGESVVTVDMHGTARVWDSTSGKLWHGRPPLVHALATNRVSSRMRVFPSPDDQRLATSTGHNLVHLWDRTFSYELTPPLGHSNILNLISSVSFSPGGERILIGSEDGTARIWDAITGLPVLPPFKHADKVAYATFSPDGETVATASFDHTAQLWNARTGQALGEPLTHSSSVLHVAFSNDGKRLVSASSDFTAQVWSATTQLRVGNPLVHRGRVKHAVFSPDGKTVATSSYDHTSRLWDATTGNPLCPPLQHKSPVIQSDFSADGLILMTRPSYYAQEPIRLWEVNTGLPVSNGSLGPDRIMDAKFHPLGHQLLAAGESRPPWGAEKGMVTIHNIQPISGPAEDLAELARLLSPRKIGPNGTLVPSELRTRMTNMVKLPVSTVEPKRDRDRGALLKTWQTLRARYPQQFMVRPDRIRRWHELVAWESESAKDWHATVFHLDLLLKHQPHDSELQRRRDAARLRLEKN